MRHGDLAPNELSEYLNQKHCEIGNALQEIMSNLNNAHEFLLGSPPHELPAEDLSPTADLSPTTSKFFEYRCRQPEDVAARETGIPIFAQESNVGEPMSTTICVPKRDFTKELDLDPKVSWVSKELPEKGSSFFAGILQKAFSGIVCDSLERSMSVQEPTRSGILFQIVSSNLFKSSCAAVIFLNGLFIVWATNYGIQHLGESPLWMENVELAFLIFYSLELFVKLIVHRIFFFLCEDWKWNVFDLSLVIFVAFELVASKLSKMQAGNSQMMNMTFLRVVRIIKVAKIGRMFRAMRFCSDIRLMLDCITGSVSTLFWCLLVIVFVLYVYALYFVQSMTHYLMDNKEQLNESHKVAVKQAFGSVQQGMLSLFQAVTGGIDWKMHYDLVATSGGIQAGLYVFYVAFFVVVAWNIITSTFLEKASKIAKPNLDQMMFEKHTKDLDDSKHLADLFDKMDIDRSKTISSEEFQRVTDDPMFQKFLQVRGIDIKDARAFWAMMMSVDGSGEVDISTCVSSCLRMKGFATSIDLHTIGFEAKVMHLKCMQCLNQCAESLQRIQTHLERNALGHPET